MILLTGASGCLGRLLVDLLDGVWAPSKQDLDLSRPDDLCRTICMKRPRTIIHAGAWTDVDGCEREPERAFVINWMATRAIASAAIKCEATLIYISTDYVFDGARPIYSEHDDPNPLNTYGKTKLWGEREALRVPRGYVVRTSWVFGPGGRSFLSRFLDMAAAGKSLFAITDQVSRPTYAPRLASLLTDFARARLPFGLYHLAGATDATYMDFVTKGLEIAGLRADVRAVSSQELQRPAKRPPRSSLSSETYKTFTGKEIPGWQETLEEYVEWWKASKEK
ncbi:MAG: dTDP-4-dehydrorhamnose reductase [candidate division WOR-3 bacterium]